MLYKKVFKTKLIRFEKKMYCILFIYAVRFNILWKINSLL